MNKFEKFLITILASSAPVIAVGFVCFLFWVLYLVVDWLDKL